MPAIAVFDWFAELARSSWAYAITPVVILVDAFVMVLPAETVLHAGGVGAAQGDVSLVVVIAIASAAAATADFALYTLAARNDERIERLLVRGERSRRRYGAVCGQLRERSWLLTIARFVPGLRSVTMIAAGATHLGRRRYLAYEVPGALLWAMYNVLIGYFLGLVFRDAGFWVPLLVSAAIATGLGLLFEMIRRAKGVATA